ncbi:hypothetical protein DL98DRAFT_639863 [Cadophora sp. DSE1049]|nr:hypothetical protein DL98DRAFT_639863 [Cadophora sp. DSE1049]
MADAPIPLNPGPHPNDGQPVDGQTADQEPDAGVVDAQDDVEGLEPPLEGAGIRARKRPSMLRVCGISTAVLVIYFTLLYVVVIGTPHARKFWERIPHSPAHISQQHLWRRSKPPTAFCNNANSASGACESFWYDSYKDMFLRYVNETENSRSLHPTTATYVRQYADKSTSVPLTNIPHHVADKIHDAVQPKLEKVANERANIRDWFSNPMDSLKPGSAQELSPSDELTAVPTKVVENVKKVFEKIIHPTLRSQAGSSKEKPGLQQDEYRNVDPTKFAENAKKILGKLSQPVPSSSRADLASQKSGSETQSHVDKPGIAKKTDVLRKSPKKPPEKSKSSSATQKPPSRKVEAAATEASKKVEGIGKRLKKHPAAPHPQPKKQKSNLDDKYSDYEAETPAKPTGLRGWISSRVAFLKPNDTPPTDQRRPKRQMDELKESAVDSRTKWKDSNREKSKARTPKTKFSTVQQKKSDRYPPSEKEPKHDDFTKDTVISIVPKSSTTRKKGAFEEYWSEFRMQGPPTAVISRSREDEESPSASGLGSKSEAAHKRKVLTAERLSFEEEYRLKKGELSKLRSKYGVTSQKRLKEETQGTGKTIYAKDRKPGSKKTTKDEDIKKTIEKQHSQQTEKATSAQGSKSFIKKTSSMRDSRVDQRIKSPASKPESDPDHDDRHHEEIVADKETMVQPTWHWKLMSKIGIPVRLSQETAASTSELAAEDVAETIPESTFEVSGSKLSRGTVQFPFSKVPSQKKESNKIKSAVTVASFAQILKQGLRRLQIPDPDTTPSDKTSQSRPAHKNKSDKSKSKFTTTEPHHVGSPQSSSANGFSRSTNKQLPRTRSKASSSQEEAGTKPAEVLIDSIVGALRDLKIVSPSEPERRTWRDWSSSVLDFSWVLGFFAEVKKRISSLPGIVIVISKPIVDKNASGKRSSWTSWFFTSSKWTSKRAPIREQTPEEKRWEKFFNHVRQSSKNKTAEAILDISGTLYSIIDQLMAEGNKHFVTMTRLRGAWEGLYRAEAVMDSSRTVRTMGSDTENRNLLQSYVGVIYKFDRLVADVSDATSRMANSTVVTAADATHWKTMKGRFNKFLWEVRKRPLFVDRGLLVSEGFHRDILLGGREKLQTAKMALERLRESSAI